MLTTGQDTQQLINSAQAQDRYNKNWESNQAQKQMEFQNNSNAKAMAFSAQQAQISRDFEERMSNTAHQREIQDLIKAGLNPVLSATKGASTPNSTSASGVSSSGAKGNSDGGMVQMFNQMVSAIINQATALNTTSMSNMTALQQTKMLNDTALKTSQMGANAMLGTANINAQSNQLIQQNQLKFQEYMAQTYPASVTGGVAAIVDTFHKWLNNGENNNALSNSKFGDAIQSIGLSMEYARSLDWNDPKNWGYLGKVVEFVQKDK